MTRWEAEHQRLAASCVAVAAATDAQRREREAHQRYEREDTWEARAEWLRARREARRWAS